MQWPKRNRNNLERHNLKLLTKCVNIYLKKNPKFIKESSKSWVFTKNLLENCQYD